MNYLNDGDDIPTQQPHPAEDFFISLTGQLRSMGLKLMCFGDFVEILASYEGGVNVPKEAQKELATYFTRFSVHSIPQVHSGNIPRTLSSPIVVLQTNSTMNRPSEGFRNASLITKVAAVMAKSDSVVSEEETNRVLSRVESLPFLTSDEILFLKAQSLYLLSTGTRRDLLVEKLSTASPGLKTTVLEVAMDIAIADGILETSELFFLQDLYRAFDLSARSARTDLEKYARENYVVLEKRHEPKVDLPENTSDELEDVLGDLLTEFEF